MLLTNKQTHKPTEMKTKTSPFGGGNNPNLQLQKDPTCQRWAMGVYREKRKCKISKNELNTVASLLR